MEVLPINKLFPTIRIQHNSTISGVSRIAYPRGANRGRGFGAPGKLKNGAPRRRCWMGEGGSMLEVIISFSGNVKGIRLLKIALTLN